MAAMGYTEDFRSLKKVFAQTDTYTDTGDFEFYKQEFDSASHDLLPGNPEYFCKPHGKRFDGSYSFYNDVGTLHDNVHVTDVSVGENRKFSYYILKPKGTPPAKKVIFLFHGFNEKNWDKYLPWGKSISEQTGSAVVFFPIAFHMQRAPQHWSEKRKMFALSEERKKRFPNIINSTLSNVAISMRLHSMPQRFIWSGLQTYYDVINFIEDCKRGKHPLIAADFSFDVFAYSIGGLLAMILKLSDHKSYFANTKVCLFCSGAVFNRLSPVSKFIIDSEANVAMYSYLVEHFDSYLARDPHLRHYIQEDHFEGKVFRSMLEYQKMRDFREELFKKIENQVYAVSLKKDKVIPSFEILNTLQGAFRNINIRVEEEDYRFDYKHENPFPDNDRYSNIIDEAFERIFGKIGEFLK